MEMMNKEPKLSTIALAMVLLTVAAGAVVYGSLLTFIACAGIGSYLLTPVKTK
jgi:hypothetical protein